VSVLLQLRFLDKGIACSQGFLACRFIFRRSTRSGGSSSRFSIGDCCAWQHDLKFGELARLRIDLNRPAMLLDDDVVTNGQT
jgi:hypothetical protein